MKILTTLRDGAKVFGPGMEAALAAHLTPEQGARLLAGGVLEGSWKFTGDQAPGAVLASATTPDVAQLASERDAAVAEVQNQTTQFNSSWKMVQDELAGVKAQRDEAVARVGSLDAERLAAVADRSRLESELADANAKIAELTVALNAAQATTAAGTEKPAKAGK